jgi:hypothetical protein
MTPVLVPPVITHARAEVAAETRPLLSSSSSSGSRLHCCALPVTEMMISGGGIPQFFSMNCRIRAAGLVSEIVMKRAVVPMDGNEIEPWSEGSPLLRTKICSESFLNRMSCTRQARCMTTAARSSSFSSSSSSSSFSSVSCTNLPPSLLDDFAGGIGKL